MKKLILGFILGVIVLAVFLFIGGARYLKVFGAKTEEAGTKLERVEKEMKESAKSAEKTAVVAKDKVKKTAVETKEKVKKYIP